MAFTLLLSPLLAVRRFVNGTRLGLLALVRAVVEIPRWAAPSRVAYITGVITFFLTLRLMIHVFHSPQPYIEDDPKIYAKLASIRKNQVCQGLLGYHACKVSPEKHGSDRQGSMIYTAATFDVPGLGNLMFQYASLYGIATRSRRSAVVPRNITLRRIFHLSNQTLISNSSRPGEKWGKVLEKGPSLYDKAIAELRQPHHIEVVGFLQSWMYFDHVQNELRQEHFQFRESILSSADHFLRDSLQSFRVASGERFDGRRGVTYVGVHVRRGDLLKDQMVRYGYKTADAGYFERAMRYYSDHLSRRNVIYVVCSDDIRWCRANIRSRDDHQFVVFSEGRSAGQDLAILSRCNHSITSVGTFSWWSAWLTGGNATFFTGHPRIGSPLETRAFSRSRADYFPKHWVGL